MAKSEAELRKKVEERYMMLQLISSQIQEVQKEMSQLEEQAVEVSNLQASLKTLSQTKENSKTFSPLGLGTYIESEIKNTNKVLVNVGSGVFVKKTSEEAGNMMNKQITQLNNVTAHLTENLTTLATRAQEIEKEIQELVK